MNEGDKKEILDEIDILKAIVLNNNLAHIVQGKENEYSTGKSEISKRLSNLIFLGLGSVLGFLVFFKIWVFIVLIFDALLFLEIINILIFNKKQEWASKNIIEGRETVLFSQKRINESVEKNDSTC